MELNPLHENTDARRYPGWLTLLRIALGLILLMKGISFLYDLTGLEMIIQDRGGKMISSNAQTLSFLITYINLLGGVFIAVGFITRWAALLQLPILLGAVFLVNIEGGMTLDNRELFLSIIALVLCIVFVIRSSGPISADEFFRSYTNAGRKRGQTKKFFQ